MESLKTKAEELNREIKEVVDLFVKVNISASDFKYIDMESLEGFKKTLTCGDSLMNFIVDEAERMDKLEEEIKDLDKKMDKILDGIHRLECRNNKAKES